MVTMDQPRATENTGEPYHTKPHKLNQTGQASKPASEQSVVGHHCGAIGFTIINGFTIIIGIVTNR